MPLKPSRRSWYTMVAKSVLAAVPPAHKPSGAVCPLLKPNLPNQAGVARHMVNNGGGVHKHQLHVCSAAC
jgi:hypothetical protein